MNIKLLIIAAVSCIQSSNSFFYGANIQLPQATTLSFTLNQCVTTLDILDQKLCQINKKALVFTQPGFANLANFVTDIQYIFQNVKEFYNYFLRCLNDQSQQITSEVSIRNLKILIYQLNNYVIPGFINSFYNSAEAYGAVFGPVYQRNVAAIANIFNAKFGAILLSLDSLVQSFTDIAAAGQTITANTLNVTLNGNPFSSMVNAFKDICVIESTYSTLLDGVWATISSLETIILAVDKTQSGITVSINKAQFNYDLANQAAKKIFSDKVGSYAYTVDTSMEKFNTLAGKLFVLDAEVINYRQILETYVGSLKLILDNTNSAFGLLLTNNIKSVSFIVTNTNTALNSAISTVKTNFQNMIATSGSTVGPCFNANTATAVTMVDNLGFNATQCLSAQNTVANQGASLLAFILEDVVIEALGVIDKMCSCAVAGDPTTVRRAKACMQKVTSDLNTSDTGVLALATKYLQTEFGALASSLGTAISSMNTCIQRAISNFATNYGAFNSNFGICMIG